MWQATGLEKPVIEIYLRWIRRYRAALRSEGIDEIERLTLADAIGFARSYVGPRRGRLVRASSRAGLRHALHAWSCALHLLGEVVPEWDPALPSLPLPSLLA